jgi:phosphoribosylcarboxyaminoimidazole (NCAIR) mutase
MRRIGIMIGSDSDLPQCLAGLQFLQEVETQNLAKVLLVITNSIHRNTEKVLQNLRKFTRRYEIFGSTNVVDVWIIGAGWANHLTGTCDAYLRNEMKNDRVPVIGVAFESDDPDKTLAAILSIEAVPGFQGIFDRNRHVGSIGFFNACYDAVYANLPEIKLPLIKPTMSRKLGTAIQAAREALKK